MSVVPKPKLPVFVLVKGLVTESQVLAIAMIGGLVLSKRSRARRNR